MIGMEVIHMWILMAMLSALFAGITAILTKIGIKQTDSDVAMAIRTFVVLIFSWLIVLIVGSLDTLTELESKSIVFLILSGLATGVSWICYFKALSMTGVNKVTPIDKSSTVLTVLLAVVLFGETNQLVIKIIGIIIITLGIFMMIEKKDIQESVQKSGWFIYAVLSAIFASLTSILAKIGITGVETNLATALRTIVVLVMACAIVIGKRKANQVKEMNKRELVFIIFSGFATGASWLCYYYAIQKGIVSVVIPIDKLSILVTIAFSYLFLQEKLKKKSAIGLCFMVIGTLMMTIFGEIR
jgi:transporter family protein